MCVRKGRRRGHAADAAGEEKGGLDVLVHLVRMHLDEIPAHVCVKLDIRNMFNEIERAAIIRVFEANPRLRDMVPFLFAVHSPMSPVFYPDGKAADKSCAEGTRQGAPEAGHGASAAIQAPLENADAALRATGGFARADFDDTYLCGVPAEVATALVAFEAAIALVGAEVARRLRAFERGRRRAARDGARGGPGSPKEPAGALAPGQLPGSWGSWAKECRASEKRSPR